MKQPQSSQTSISKSLSFDSRSIEAEVELAQDCQKLLDFIKDRDLVLPALIILELYRPIVGLGDALLIISQPFLKIFMPQQRIFEILGSREKVDWLIVRLSQIQTATKEVLRG